MGTHKKLLKTAFLAFFVLTVAACRSTSEPEDTGIDDSAARAAAAAEAARAAELAEQERLRREREAQDRIEQAALNTTVFYFDFDISDFQPADRETLVFHARNLSANPNRRIRLEGHADERGTREYNLALGERRANSIRDFLIVNGASRNQIETVSYGEERPAVRGQTEEAYRLNRRVEILPGG